MDRQHKKQQTHMDDLHRRMLLSEIRALRLDETRREEVRLRREKGDERRAAQVETKTAIHDFRSYCDNAAFKWKQKMLHRAELYLVEQAVAQAEGAAVGRERH